MSKEERTRIRVLNLYYEDGRMPVKIAEILGIRWQEVREILKTAGVAV